MLVSGPPLAAYSPMESSYDEDLNDNVFFQTLRTDYGELFEKATVEGWIICVPRAGSMPKFALSYNEFFSHILIPSFELPETHFRSLNDKDVRINNRVISVETSDFAVPFSIHILFEETFYTEDMLKYKVLCIETPMCLSPDCYKAESGVINVNTLRDCVDLLWTESSKEVLEKMDEHISSFLSNNDDLEIEPLQTQKDLVGELYTQCLQTALKDTRLRDKTAVNRYLLDNVKVSVESYVLHGVYKKLIKGITRCTAAEDASFNKIVRNLADIQLRDLDINQEFQDVIPKARTELVKVEGYSTVLGKVGCIKRTVSAISNLNLSNSKSNIVATDELIPLLVFLVLKTGLPNWLAHLTYIKEFSFSSNDSHSNQHSYLVTSLEAVIEHIRSGIVIGPSEPESQIDYDLEDNEEEDIMKMKKSLGMTPLSKLFELAKVGDHEHLENVLNKETQKFGSLDNLNLCHPLCACDSCERKVSIYLCNMAPTVNSCDDRGLNILHIAAIYGHPKVVDVILKYEANINKSDYKGATPLHYASARGHQNIILLLLQSGARIDQPDNEGNIPLHLAANNGHENCVKALLCYAEYMNLKFDINFANNQGDTALHNAARWGYETIVFLLLEYGAMATIENKRKLTPIDNAHNMDISSMLGISIIKKLNISSPSETPTKTNDVVVAAASKTHLDFVDHIVENDVLRKQEYQGIIPNSTNEIKKVERALRAISYGDIRLACFYLGLELNSHTTADKSCHPLCSCRNPADNDSPFGDGKADQPLNINVCDSDGMTPLHVACFYGRNELVSLLVEAGAFINAQTRQNKMTPLHLACQKEHFNAVESLLSSRKCDINLQDVQGNTALHYACHVSNLNIVKKILEYKPKVNCKNSRNKTALEEAKESVSVSIVSTLTDYLRKST